MSPSGTIVPVEVEMANASELGATVEARRRALHLRQEEVAELADVSVRFVRALEHGKPSVRLDKLVDVLDVLGLELDIRLRSR